MAAGSRYGITLKELRELMEFRGDEGVEKLKGYGGAQGLAKKLNTSETAGKNKHLIKKRQIIYIYMSYYYHMDIHKINILVSQKQSINEHKFC